MPFDYQFRLRLGGLVGTDVPLVPTTAWLQKMLAFMSVTPTPAQIPLTDMVCNTYQNMILFTPVIDVAELTQSDYDGYFGDQAMNPWSPPGLDDAGNVVVVGDLPVPYQVLGDPAGQIVAGVYMLDGDGELAFGATIDPAIVLVDTMVIPMTFVIQLGNLA